MERGLGFYLFYGLGMVQLLWNRGRCAEPDIRSDRLEFGFSLNNILTIIIFGLLYLNAVNLSE